MKAMIRVKMEHDDNHKIIRFNEDVKAFYCKSIKNKPKTNKKDIKVEDTNLTDLKSTSIKVDKSTWEDFERLCSNSQFTKQEIITQALKDFMKEYKNLL